MVIWIDWSLDSHREMLRRMDLAKMTGRAGIMMQVWDWLQDGLLILSIGSLLGILAGCIDISEGFLSDFREGFCRTDFTLNKNFCCYGLDGK
jgi:chloride channel 3/4/5